MKTKWMRRTILAMLLFTPWGALSAEGNVSAYFNYLDAPVYNYSRSQTESELGKYQRDDFDDESYSITKGLLLFWASLKNLKDEKITSQATQHWERLHSSRAGGNPLTLAFYGTVEAMYGGALSSPDPVKKTRLALDGMAKLSKALDQLKENAKDDYLSLGFVYFLDGYTRSSLPSFFKEKAAAPDRLKAALKYYSKARKQDIYTKDLIYHFVAHTYHAYAVFYIGDGNIRKASKYLDKAQKYLDALDGSYALSEEIREKKAKLE